MKIDRLFTQAAKDPYASLEFESRSSVIRNPDGSVVAEWKDVQVPKTWSQVASDIMAQKYFRKAGIPKHRRKRSEEGIPSWLQTSVPDQAKQAKLPADEKMVSENDARQVFDRLAGCWTYWGHKYGYFNDESSSQAFYDELRYMLANQMVAPNSPQWFNTGLNWAYGITGPAQGHYYVDANLKRSKNLKTPTVIPNHMLASSNPSRTIWSKREGLWISGSEKLACSNMVLERDPTSRIFVVAKNHCLEAVSLPV